MLAKGYHHMLPVYPLIAQQILDDYGIDKGICLDVGSGPGYLGIELAKITHLEMFFIDISEQALAKAENSAACVDNKLHFTQADTTNLPFEDCFADIIISRGSLWFWKNQREGLQEIHRVLKPGQPALIGGGLGRYTPLTMRKRLKGKTRKALQQKGETGFLDEKGLQNLIEDAGLARDARVITDVEGEPGTWVEIIKTHST